jgi:hypothetical protein
VSSDEVVLYALAHLETRIEQVMCGEAKTQSDKT